VLFSFFHLRGPATQLALGCATAERSAGHWLNLLRIRFEQLTLPEAVIAVRLRGGYTQAVRAESGRLRFQNKAGQQGLRFSMAQLAERLVARGGSQSVASVTTVADHRPQLAWRLQGLLTGKTANTVSTSRRGLPRPLWMLPEPALLAVEQGYPLHRGRLQIVQGPERLETGWWDEDGIARDYYTAVNPHGMRLWVYQNRSREAPWYLHGFFG
jgi:protein ImuB